MFKLNNEPLVSIIQIHVNNINYYLQNKYTNFNTEWGVFKETGNVFICADTERHFNNLISTYDKDLIDVVVRELKDAA